MGTHCRQKTARKRIKRNTIKGILFRKSRFGGETPGYEFRCAISGIAIPELLNASHITPWQEDTERRTDPCKGISTIAAMATPEWRTTFTSF